MEGEKGKPGQILIKGWNGRHFKGRGMGEADNILYKYYGIYER